MKSMSKWHWGLVVITVVIAVGVFTGPTGIIDRDKNPEVTKVVAPDQPPSDMVLPLSFSISDLNAKVEMRCIDPTSHSGFSWKVLSLDKKSSPKATKIFFNFAKTKHDPIVPSGWRGIQPSSDKIPVGDAFMLTALQLKTAGSQNYNHYVFTVANSLEEAQKAKDVVYVPVEVVSLISESTLQTHPCSTLQPQ